MCVHLQNIRKHFRRFGSNNLYLEEVPSPLTLSFVLPNPEIKTRAILTEIHTDYFVKNCSCFWL